MLLSSHTQPSIEAKRRKQNSGVSFLGSGRTSGSKAGCVACPVVGETGAVEAKVIVSVKRWSLRQFSVNSARYLLILSISKLGG